ncbi:sigma factor-like helix-turn-helix DNA-binding protein [Streptomyces sp. NPDC012935]|uniref:sigma factor-like helix-turn-helix DNA-binding protein n=1 Tax=Streptomyces sp. NPDC012935 TaxID=3364857 RepID=UPI0036AD135C
MPPTHAVLPAGHDFATYARTHWSRLVVTARLLTDDAGAAQELVRRTLVRMCARWRAVPRDDVDFHVRRCLVQTHLRPLRGRRAARRRTVLVLRIWEGLADAEIAQLLGCSVGAVRAQARHGLKEAGDEPVRLREMYARAVEDLVPSEVPLADLRTQGRARRRRRLAVTSTACVALLTPVTVALLSVDQIGGGARDGVSGARGQHATTSPIRVVAPGERVTVGPGVRVWLTADGGHWSVPDALPQDDNHLPVDDPGGAAAAVSVRADTVQGGFLLSGLFRGLRGEPSHVEVRTGDGNTTAKVLVLAGSPGWGVWYAPVPLPGEDMKALLSLGGDQRIVTVFDASGKVAARSGREWWRI